MLITIDHRLNAKALGLNANEASVLAAITKCTQSGNGWYADIDALADALEFSVSAKTVSRAVKKLIEMGLVEKRQNVLYAQTNCPSVETKCPESGTNCPSPTPPINKINNMERNEKIARAQIRTAQVQNNPSFEELVKAFTLRVRDFKMADSTRDECLRMWSDMPEWKRRMLIAQVQSGEWIKPRLDWLISDFNPQPTNWNGLELQKGVKYKAAKWQGKWGTYSIQDIRNFELETPIN